MIFVVLFFLLKLGICATPASHVRQKHKIKVLQTNQSKQKRKLIFEDWFGGSRFLSRSRIYIKQRVSLRLGRRCDLGRSTESEERIFDEMSICTEHCREKPLSMSWKPEQYEATITLVIVL